MKDKIHGCWFKVRTKATNTLTEVDSDREENVQARAKAGTAFVWSENFSSEPDG